MSKKKFSETKVGKFLKSIGSSIFGTVGEVLPDKGLLGVLKGLITKSNTLSVEDKKMALKYLEMDIIEMQEVSKRWDSDMTSDSWLSKNVRPITLIFFSVAYVSGWFLNYSLENITGLLSLIVGAYFGSRGLEKFKTISQKK
jgi:hypothetical protein|tara:strand:+ start:358 stop:783 length:426 start_codon:yes stop_codon:yes gene_type:complete